MTTTSTTTTISGFDILLQPPQSLLCIFEHVVILADRKSQPVFGEMGILVREEFRRWDRSHAELLEDEPAELEIAGSRRDVGRKVVVFGELDFRQVGEDEVAAFRVGELLPVLEVLSRLS